MTEKEPNN